MHQQMNPSDPNYLRFYYDYLYGLDFRGHSKVVIENFTVEYSTRKITGICTSCNC